MGDPKLALSPPFHVALSSQYTDDVDAQLPPLALSLFFLDPHSRIHLHLQEGGIEDGVGWSVGGHGGNMPAGQGIVGSIHEGTRSWMEGGCRWARGHLGKTQGRDRVYVLGPTYYPCHEGTRSWTLKDNCR